jgi:hypothetical protein
MNVDIKLHSDYVYTRQLDLDLDEQRYAARTMYEYIASSFVPNGVTDYSTKGRSTLTTNLYAQYNYFLYPIPGLHQLYEKIKETFHTCHSATEPFYMQAWLNVYRTGEFLDWHTHWGAEFESWHGFYCVDVEPDSSTTYRLFGRRPELDDIVIPSKDNLLVISRSDGDTHRSSEWNYKDRPRITVAFDIVPVSKLYERRNYEKNHWIPI